MAGEKNKGIDRFNGKYVPSSIFIQRHEHLKGLSHHSDNPQRHRPRLNAIADAWQCKPSRKGGQSNDRPGPFPARQFLEAVGHAEMWILGSEQNGVWK